MSVLQIEEFATECSGHATFTLARPIAAINFSLSETGEARTGLITQLPKDAAVELYGAGFNERTVSVRWHDGFYFVFLQDIEPAEAYDFS